MVQPKANFNELLIQNPKIQNHKNIGKKKKKTGNTRQMKIQEVIQKTEDNPEKNTGNTQGPGNRLRRLMT